MKQIVQTIRKPYSHPRVRVVNITPNALLAGSDPHPYDDELDAKRNILWLNDEEEDEY